MLGVFFPNVSIDELLSHFDFKFSRTYNRSLDRYKAPKFTRVPIIQLEGLPQDDILLIQENKFAYARVLKIVSAECDRIRSLISTE